MQLRSVEGIALPTCAASGVSNEDGWVDDCLHIDVRFDETSVGCGDVPLSTLLLKRELELRSIELVVLFAIG